MLTPQQAADKWAQKAGAAGGDYKAGIQGVTVAPGQLAVQNQAAMVNNWNNAINSGQWANRTAAVSLGAWQQAASGKGAQNYATGVAAGKSKMAAAMAYYLPVAQAVKEAVRGIPRDGGAGSLARVQLAMDAFKQAKANRR
jgi:hypothetical protein